MGPLIWAHGIPISKCGLDPVSRRHAVFTECFLSQKYFSKCPIYPKFGFDNVSPKWYTSTIRKKEGSK